MVLAQDRLHAVRLDSSALPQQGINAMPRCYGFEEAAGATSQQEFHDALPSLQVGKLPKLVVCYALKFTQICQEPKGGSQKEGPILVRD